ncbi:replication endonuclease [Pseudoduganella namucuonensis]|uniref:Bacteriophage replication gene A protein (GPA) n=1 Tax=Pseudoduganella namucuonensis TaxID=1035707 RepID=A0A1I7KQ43_9BURK|nr:replication endonuclease [Pseudoduganella namucuonensis]SFU99563.1 Bacteriophage replication gene A protein (GPA) [Pseudoduganella namucuonensis]
MLARDQHPANPEWAAAKVAPLPRRWQGRLFRGWEKRRNAYNAADLGAEGEATRGAAYWLAETLDSLRTTSLPLDASDADICARADECARNCTDLASAFHQVETLRAAMEGACRASFVKPPIRNKRMTDSAAIARMTCPMWWRRRLRRAQANAVEAAAISIGYVNRTRDVYVSNESVACRVQQNRRNAAMLDATKARNEIGQEMTLTQLVAVSVSNPAIKRGELMTRLAGFERIAREFGHEGLFLTITCPSRMHKWRTVAGGRVVENPRYDGTKPDEAQRYLSKMWGLLRSKLDRDGLQRYGFRIAEPNHDGTPHWHMILFFDPVFKGGSARAHLHRVVRRYALADSPNEPGAQQHRVNSKRIDWSKGSAAAYLAKYISKNIDGYRVGEDLYGNPALETCRRVEAWAATWRIRQFQQIGGAPVTPWREARRVKELPADAPAHVALAHRACNKVAAMEGDGPEGQSVAWDLYTKAQGGVFVGRDYRIKVLKEDQGGTGRYGEPLPAKPVGLVTVVEQEYRDGIVFGTRLLNWVVKSARHQWEIIVRGGGQSKGGAAPAWTRVNNCTRGDFENLSKRFNESISVLESLDRLYNPEFHGPWNVPELQNSLKEKQWNQPNLSAKPSRS